jgi:hypothetical protein
MCEREACEMTISTAVFERLGIQVSSDVIERLVAEAIEQMLPYHRVANPSAELTPNETAALIRAGLDLGSAETGANNALVRSAAEYAALIATGLTVAQAARKLGLDGSRIRHRLADQTLYGIKLSSGWRLPSFQFVGDGLVPGLNRVLPRLDAGLHPLSVLHWFTRPNPDLFFDDDETSVSPLDWLRTGRDPAVVAELAGHVGTGA